MSTQQPAQQLQPAVTPNAPAVASAPTFSYDLYCDKKGHFSYDGAALALVKRASHLQLVYADAARGESRPKQLIHELEYWFQQAGIAVADRTAALSCRALPELQSNCRPPNWDFLEQFLGDTPECVRLREVLAEAYARRAQQLDVRNDVIVGSVNLLLAESLAKTILARAGVVEARASAQRTLASEAKATEGLPALPRSLGAAANITTRSRIGASSYATRLAEGLGQAAQRDVDALLGQLRAGNMNPGIGTRALGGGFFELRGANSGRVIVKQTGAGSFDIVGKFQGHVRGDAANSAIIQRLMNDYLKL